MQVHGDELEKKMYGVLQACEVTTVNSSGSPILANCSPNIGHSFHDFKVDVLSEARKELTY